jgi:hypothetical protein
VLASNTAEVVVVLGMIVDVVVEGELEGELEGEIVGGCDGAKLSSVG